MNSEQVIVYRSKWESERDQFFFNNPEYILYIAGGCLAIVLLVVVVDKIKKFFGIRR